jgi:NCAIR mutase (PurE)-related protein
MELDHILKLVQNGSLSIEEAKHQLQTYEDLGFAKLDLHREKRTGFPEVIFSQGKTTEQVVSIFKRLMDKSDRVLATRVSEEQGAAVLDAVPEATFNRTARTLTWLRDGSPPTPYAENGYVAVVCAGTSDLPVAEEAAITAECMGHPVERVYDVGVAGIHRLFHHLPTIQGASAVVVVAGMEGALASVVGGLVASPVIAVPTSVGYGASFGGVAALLTMLNSCATGVTVVNIDNGFGAGYTAALINRIARAK